MLCVRPDIQRRINITHSQRYRRPLNQQGKPGFIMMIFPFSFIFDGLILSEQHQFTAVSGYGDRPKLFWQIIVKSGVKKTNYILLTVLFREEKGCLFLKVIFRNLYLVSTKSHNHFRFQHRMYHRLNRRLLYLVSSSPFTVSLPGWPICIPFMFHFEMTAFT